jgi:recombination protein RecA
MRKQTRSLGDLVEECPSPLWRTGPTLIICSGMSLASLQSPELLAVLHHDRPRAKPLPLGLTAIDEALPEGGLPRGAVVELSAPRGLARATTLALAACASAQAAACARGAIDSIGAWCAFIDPASTLFAPGVVTAGVDLTRLLVVRPPLDALARVAVRVASSRAFSVVVIDAAGVPGGAAGVRLDRWSTITRRLALSVEGGDTTVLLLTDRCQARSMPLPVAMRIELERPAPLRMSIRVAKDRRGRVTSPASIALGQTG